MRVLIIVPRWNAGDRANYAYMFPLGLAYISSAIKQAGHDVHCLNLNHYDGLAEELIAQELCSDRQYDAVCTGAISTYYHQIKEVVDAVRRVNSGIKIILGGGLISSEPEFMLNLLSPDFIVIGEGEKTICELLNCLRNKGDLSKVAGIGYRDDMGKFICNRPQAPIEKIDSIPFPDFESFEYEKYLDHMRPSDLFDYNIFDYPRVYPIICSRSCPFRCTFCYHPIGNKYRQRSLDSIMQELELMVKRYRINIVAIYDELFSNNRERLYEFCCRIKKLLADLPWECRWGCQLRVDKVDDDILAMMKDAGCYLVSYGFESYSAAVLRSMKKFITPDQIDRALQATLKNSLSLHGNFIFGDEAETSQTVKETLDYWERNVQAGILLGFVNPYPGTQLYQHCLERGIIKDKIDFIANHIFDVLNMSRTMTDKEFKNMVMDIYKANWRYRIYARKFSLVKMHDGVFALRVQCPHCKKEIEYKNFSISSKYFFHFMVYCRYCRLRFHVASGIYRISLKGMLVLFSIVPGFLLINIVYNVRSFKKGIKHILRDMLINLLTKKMKDYASLFAD